MCIDRPVRSRHGTPASLGSWIDEGVSEVVSTWREVERRILWVVFVWVLCCAYCSWVGDVLMPEACYEVILFAACGTPVVGEGEGAIEANVAAAYNFVEVVRRGVYGDIVAADEGVAVVAIGAGLSGSEGALGFQGARGQRDTTAAHSVLFPVWGRLRDVRGGCWWR